MPNSILIFSLVFMLLSCSETNKKPIIDASEEIASVLEEIKRTMAEQENSWNRADIEAFMQPYWQSDSLSFIGKNGITRGWQQTLENYKKAYPNPEAMGKLEFENYHIEVLNPSNAYVVGHWQLNRSLDTLQGHYTLLWKKMAGKWLIVSDHSS